MKISFTRSFIRSYDKLYQFMDDWRHPSFRIHELGGTDKVWSARNSNTMVALPFPISRNTVVYEFVLLCV